MMLFHRQRKSSFNVRFVNKGRLNRRCPVYIILVTWERMGMQDESKQNGEVLTKYRNMRIIVLIL